MRSRIMLLAVAFAACGGHEDAGAPRVAGARSDDAPVRHERHLWFVSRGPDGAFAAAFDFDIVQEGGSHRRVSRAWLGRNGAWSPVLDTIWQTDAVREPQRLLPHGSLRLLVDDSGGLEAMVVGRGDGEVRLVPGRALASWTAGVGVELVLSFAELRAGDTGLAGMLVDTRLTARPLTAESGIRQVFVTDGASTHLILADSPPHGAQLWVRRGDEDLVEAATLVRSGADGAGSAPSEDVWYVETANGYLRAELRAVAGDDDGAPDHRAVAGVIAIGAEERAVSGIVRDGPR